MRGRWLKHAALSLALLSGSAVVALELYTRLPDPVDIPVIKVSPDTRELTLVFHGSGGSDEPLMQRIAAAHEGDPTGAAAVAVNWSPASDNRLRAAANARVVGAALGAKLGSLENLQRLRLVGHSSGAYMLDAVCVAARAAAKPAPVITSVYLDPFGIDGFADWSHGAREHGRCADFALAIINTDDAAPATNAPLANAYNIDITDHPQRPDPAAANLHYWPVEFYARAAAERRLPSSAEWSHDQLPRGVVVASLPDLATD